MPTGPGGAEQIGKVSVRVLPDTRDFFSDAKEQLRKIEKRLPKLKVEAEFDDAGLRKSILEKIREINKDLKKDLYKLKFRAAISEEGMRGAVRDARNQLNRIAKEQDRIRLSVDATIADFNFEITDKAKEELKRELEHLRDKLSPLKIGVKPDYVNGSGADLQARLKLLTRPRTVAIVPVLDKTAAAKVGVTLAALSGARVLNDTLDGLWSRLKRLDQATPIIGTLATAIAGLGALGLTSASNLFALSQSLAQIGPAALVLPGIFGGMAVATGVMVTALRDFKKEVPQISGMLSKLRTEISSNFWDKAREPIRDMVDNLFPEFRRGAALTATELGGFFAKLATSLSTVLKPQLQSMFTDLNKSILIFSGHTNSLVGIIATLGSVGAGYLPQLANYFGGLLDRFNAFLTKAANDGSLKGWIDQALFQIKELGRVIGNLGGIFAGLATAAEKAGGSSLTMLADALDQIENTVKSAGFQSAFIGLLNSAHEAFNQLFAIGGDGTKQFVSAITKTLTIVLPGVGKTIGIAVDAIGKALAQPGVQDGLIALFDGIQQAVVTLAPAMGPLGLAFGSIFKIVGALAPVLASVLGPALSTLAKVFVLLTPIIIQIIKLLGGQLSGIIQTIAPHVLKLGGILAAAFTKILPALKPVITFMGNLAKAVLPILIDGVGRVIKALTPLIVMLAKVIAVVGPVLIPIIKFLANLFIGALVGAINGVVAVFKGVGQIISGVVNVIKGVFNIIKGIVTGDGDLIKQGWSQLWGGILDLIKGFINLIVGAFLIFINVGILGTARKFFSLFTGLFKGGFGQVGTLIREFISSIKGRFTAFFTGIKNGTTTFLGGIKNLWKGVIGDIKAAISLWWALVKGLFSKGMAVIKSYVGLGINSIKGFFSNGMANARSIVSAAWTAIRSAFSKGISSAVSFMRGLPGKIRSAIGNLGSLLYNAGKSVISGFISGIKSAFSSVKSTLGSLTSSLTSWKGPPKTDATILIGAGQLVIQGFVKGLESQYGTVKKSLRDLTSDVASTAVEIPSPQVGKAGRALAAQVAATVDGAAGSSAQKVLNYYAAPGNSLDSEDDLFKAAQRARMGW